MPKNAKKQLENRRTFIDDGFCDKLKANPYKAPLLLLYEVFADMKQLDCEVPTVTPEKENHLRLHVRVAQHSFDINPEWGSFRFFAAVRPVVESSGIDFPLDGMRFGWRLGESALMTPVESAFWQSFRKRVEKFSSKNEEITLLVSRLEMGSSFEPRASNLEPLSSWLVKSLAADHLDPVRCVLFTGLEYSRGKKLHDFRNLAANTRSEDEETRMALARATYESALLGAEPFVKLWDILREFSVAMRQGGDHARDALAALKAKYKSIGKILALYSPNSAERTLFERISALSEALVDEFKFEDDNRLALGAFNESLNLSVRELREMFRPFLKARYIKDHELKNAREILSKMERMQPDDAEYPALYLQARAMLEDFEILRFKRKGDDSEEVIEDDALAKLKKSFGRLK